MQDPRPRTKSVSYHYSQFQPHQLLRSKTTEEGMPSRHPCRPQTPRTRIYSDTTEVEGPWKQMAHTFAWVVEQEFVRSPKESRHVERWLLKQPLFVADDLPPSRERKGSASESLRRREWEKLVREYQEEATKWMEHEERARRVALERERERTRLMQDEIRRIEAQVQQRRRQERQRLAEEKTKAHREKQERERRERARAERVLVDGWQKYETRWAALMGSSDPITFRTVPWPTTSPPASPASIKPAEIVLFLFSTLHSQNQTRKERIRSALLRWHPDRFRRVLQKVPEDERAAVEEGVGIVARCLNDLMGRETKIAKLAQNINQKRAG